MVKDTKLKIVKETLGLRSKNEAQEWLEALDAVIEAVYAELEEKETKTGDNVTLGKHLNVAKKFVPTRKHRNPKTNAEIIKEAHYKPVAKLVVE